MKTRAPQIRIGAWMILMSLGATQCRDKDIGGVVVLPKTIHVPCGGGCDTSAWFDLRAFIPSQLPGATPPGGPWPEPIQPLNVAQITDEANCEFYGDDRSFSTSQAASSRLHNIVDMPALPPGACNPHEAVTFDPYCNASHRRCLQNGAWVQEEPKTATPFVLSRSDACSQDDTRLDVVEKVTAAYPYIPASTVFGSIVDILSIISLTTDDGGGQVTQHYYLTVDHTPFPDHELVATVCGQTVSLYQFTTGYPGPSPSDLGLQSPFVENDLEFDVVQQSCGSESTVPTECDSSACAEMEGGNGTDRGQPDAGSDDAVAGDDGESASEEAGGGEEDGGESSDASSTPCTSFSTPGCIDFSGAIESGGDSRSVAAGSLNIDLGSGGYCLQSPCEFENCYVCPHLDTAFPQGATVTATATPSAGSVFAQWGEGACAGQGATCTFIAVKPSCITAQFLLQNPTAPPQSLPDASCPEDPTEP
jgi:hypothetical protein